MFCSTCGAEIDHTCAEGVLVGSLVTSCAVQKGALWVRVTAGGADVKGAGVTRKKVGKNDTEEHFTEETGCTGFGPLDAGDYQVALVSMPAELEPSFGLPIPAEKAAPVTQGKLTFREFALVPRVRPLIALAVEGEKRTLTLRAEPDFDGKGKGVLTVLKGAESIKLVMGATLTLTDNKFVFDSVPLVGLLVKVKAAYGAEPTDVELEWKLTSETTPVAKDAVKAVLTGFHPQGIEVVYDMSQYSRDRACWLFDLGMGKLCMSKTGKTSIYSGNFAGCLGLIISPTIGSGGMVSHILQGGGKGGGLGNPVYLMEAASKAIDMAYDLWGQLDIVLFRGSGDDERDTVQFPEMADRLRANYAPRKIRTIDDQRPQRKKGDSLFFETKSRKLYLFKGLPPDFDDYCDDLDACEPLLKESLVKSSLALETKKSPMDQFTVK